MTPVVLLSLPLGPSHPQGLKRHWPYQQKTLPLPGLLSELVCGGKQETGPRAVGHLGLEWLAVSEYSLSAHPVLTAAL